MKPALTSHSALLHGGLIGAAQGQNAPHEVAEGQGFTIFKQQAASVVTYEPLKKKNVKIDPILSHEILVGQVSI